MNKGFWRTAKQIEPFSPGKNATERVKEYERLWSNRCYSQGIPDEVPKKIAASGRAPSWRAVAVAILSNDLHLYQLGFARPCYERQCKAVQLAHIAMHGQYPEWSQLELLP
jgi:predicted phosphoadenosine phosphosulfate sulfurtransferase